MGRTCTVDIPRNDRVWKWKVIATKPRKILKLTMTKSKRPLKVKVNYSQEFKDVGPDTVRMCLVYSVVLFLE